MEREADVEFLESFREKIDEYLFLGYAPCVDPEAHEYDEKALHMMNTKLGKKELQELRRTISKMTPRTKSLLAECGVTPIVTNIPPAIVGGPIVRFHMLDLVTENGSEFRIPKGRILDVIDQAIGVLKTKGPKQHRAERYATKMASLVGPTRKRVGPYGLRVRIIKPKPKKKRLLRRRVFIVHGRNREAREAMDRFLYSLGLLPLYFDEARKLTGKATPFVLDVVEKGISATQATIVLMTPDDIGSLRNPFRGTNESAHELQLAARPRQNVIFEAGMAMALRPDKTVLVELGEPHTISDLSGLHTVRIDNSIEKREMLANSLQNAGCRVDRRGNEWKNKEKGGDFDPAILVSKFRDDERRRSLQEELQRMDGVEVKRFLEQPRFTLVRAKARRKTKPLSDDTAAVIAYETLTDHFESLGMGRVDSVPGFQVLKTGDNNRLVEGRLESIHPKRVYDFRVLVTTSGGSIVSLRPVR